MKISAAAELMRCGGEERTPITVQERSTVLNEWKMLIGKAGKSFVF